MSFTAQWPFPIPSFLVNFVGTTLLHSNTSDIFPLSLLFLICLPLLLKRLWLGIFSHSSFWRGLVCKKISGSQIRGKKQCKTFEVPYATENTFFGMVPDKKIFSPSFKPLIGTTESSKISAKHRSIS